MDKILEIILSPDSEKFRGDLFERYDISDDNIFVINSNFKKFFSGEIKFLDFLKECSDFNIKLIEEYLDFHLKLIEEYIDSDYNTLMKDFSNFIISKNNINGSDQPFLDKNDNVLNKTDEKNKNGKNIGSDQPWLINKKNKNISQRSLVSTDSYKHGDIKNILEDDKNIGSDQPLLNKNDNVLNKTGEKNKNIGSDQPWLINKENKNISQRSLVNTEQKTEKYADEIRKIIKEEVNQDFLLGAKNVNKELTDGIFNPFDDPSLIIDEVVNVIGLRFKNEQNRDKFYSILMKYLKNIRNKYQSYEILIDDKIGLSVSKIAAEKILNLTEKIKKQKENNLLEYKKNKLIQKEKKDSVNNILGISKKEDHNQERKNNSDKKGLKTEEDIFHFYDGNIEELYIKRENERSKEIDMDMDIGGDIHRDFLSNRLVGPVEELAYFTISDFRNLGEDLDERIEKLRQKINVLEEYGFNKKILGIKAWLNSEVSEIYKAILNESIEKGSIKNAVLKRKEKGEIYLTEEEINKIAELNREFRI